MDSETHDKSWTKHSWTKGATFFFLVQKISNVFIELCEIFWNISDCPGVDCCIVTGLIIPSLQT